MEPSDRAARFVVYIIYIKIFDFWVGFKKPFFDDFGTAGNWSKAAKEIFAARNLKDILVGKFF